MPNLNKYTVFILTFLAASMLLISTNIHSAKAVQYWHKDTETQGNWIENINGTWFRNYGKDGYILCGFDSQGHNDAPWQHAYDRYQLPDYITNYTVTGTGGDGPLNPGEAGVWTVTAPTSDVRALMDPDVLENDQRKNTHWFTTPYYSEEAELQVELEFSEEACHKFFHLSLYILDADQNRKLNITVQDEDPTHSQSASVTVTTDETDAGIYLVFSVYGPTTLKITLFQGYRCNPCISGIFLDDYSLPPPPNVIPEIPLGTITTTITLLAATRLYLTRKKQPKTKPN